MDEEHVLLSIYKELYENAQNTLDYYIKNNYSSKDIENARLLKNEYYERYIYKEKKLKNKK